jgi:hypothetical protein
MGGYISEPFLGIDSVNIFPLLGSNSWTTMEGLCFMCGLCRGILNKGRGEARHRNYKRLKLGGDQAYDRSSD